jgi:hypothetical protein
MMSGTTWRNGRLGLAIFVLATATGCGCGSKPAPSVNTPEPAASDNLQPVEEFAQRLREARQRAIDGGMPTGLGFVMSADQPFFANRYQFVVSAEPFSQGWLVGEKGQAFAVGHDGDKPLQFKDIEPGDLLELKQEKGRVYRIEKITANRLDLIEPLRFAMTASPKEPNFEIHRQHRPIPGEKPFALAEGWIIDMTPATPEDKGLSNHGENAVVFAPDGTLLTAQEGASIVWIRNAAAESKQEALIRIERMTGAVTVHRVNRDPSVGNGDPLHHAKSSGQ